MSLISEDKVKALVEKITKGDRRSIARAITLVENKGEGRQALLASLQNLGRKAHIIGVTGPPGAGKSSLVGKIIEGLREKNLKVGVLAIDPSSPFSQGAILGDRIRMQSYTVDKEVFIRSMGSRGSLGGLAHETKNAAKILEAAGKEVVIIETVGVGQNEVDIMKVAHTTLLVLNPGAGDSIQTMKAGIMEIADIFVINKCDLPGASRISWEVANLIHQRGRISAWETPLCETSSLSGAGVSVLINNIFKHREFLSKSTAWQDKERLWFEEEVLEITLTAIKEEIKQEILEAKDFKDPYKLAEKILVKYGFINKEN